MQRPRENADISVKPWAHPCYHIYVTLSIVVYRIACNYVYPGIIILQLRYVLHSKTLPYWHHVSETEGKTRWLKTQAIMLHIAKLTGFGMYWKAWIWFYHIDWLFIARFKHLACLFSLNMLEQCWKVWHQMKCDFINLCKINYMWQAMNISPFGLLGTEFSVCNIISLAQYDYKNTMLN